MNYKKFFLLVIMIVTTFLTVVAGVITANIVHYSKDDSDENQPSVLDKPDSFIFNKKLNVLILGTDGSELRSDVIMLASLDSKNKRVNFLSIPRDTRVKINNRYQKINAALAIGKEEMAISKVKELTGMPIHYYVKVNFKGFRNVIDILGGVDFDVPQNMYYVDPYQDLYINLKKGMQHLDGDKAEQLVRFRQYPQGDIQRIQVQQDFIKALIKQKLKIEYISKANKIFDEIKKNVDTNIGAMDITKNITLLSVLNADESIRTFQLPGEGRNIGGISYYIHDPEKVIEMVENEFGYK